MGRIESFIVRISYYCVVLWMYGGRVVVFCIGVSHVPWNHHDPYLSWDCGQDKGETTRNDPREFRVTNNCKNKTATVFGHDPAFLFSPWLDEGSKSLFVGRGKRLVCIVVLLLFFIIQNEL